MPEKDWHPSGSVYGWSLNGQTWTIMRRSDGIDALEGTTDCPSDSLVLWLLCMAIAMTAVPLFMWAMSGDWLPTAFAALVCGLLSILLMFTLASVVKVRRKLRNLHPISAVANRAGVSSELIERLSRTRGIRPRYYVNGTALYDPADFDEISTLLRPIDLNSDDSLLRMVTPSPHIASEQFLRATFPTGGEQDNVV